MTHHRADPLAGRAPLAAPAALLLLSTSLLAGCSALGGLIYPDVAYQQEANCRKLPDTNDMRACLAKVNPPNAQIEAARKPSSNTQRSQPDLCFTRAATGERVCPN